MGKDAKKTKKKAPTTKKRATKKVVAGKAAKQAVAKRGVAKKKAIPAVKMARNWAGGRPSQHEILDIYIGSTLVGALRRTPSGAVFFGYDQTWLDATELAMPISLSLPLRRRDFTGEKVSAYFDNLLPDNSDIRRRIAEREGAKSSRPFDLLAAIGRDCVGALRFLPAGMDPGPANTGEIRELTDDEVAERLRGLRQAPLGMEENDVFRLSIAGAQDKTALFRRDNGRWAVPIGSTPTTHILKPSIGRRDGNLDLSDSVENEWLTMELLREMRLPVAVTEIGHFGEEKALIVTRFDRGRRGRGPAGYFRRPQEDLCQALGIESAQKYQDHGGPSIEAIMRLLSGSIRPAVDRDIFWRAQIAYWLLSATDGHAKNFSVFLGPAGFEMAPLYDVMSGAPYGERVRRFHHRRIKMAMSVDGRYRMEDIVGRHWREMARKAGFGQAGCDQALLSLQEATGPAFERVGARLPAEIPEAMFVAIRTSALQRLRILELEMAA